MLDNIEEQKIYLDKIKAQIYPKGNASNKDGEKKKRIGILLRNVLIEHPDGPEVFSFLMEQLYYNREITLPVHMHLHNVAVHMLELMDFHGETSTVKQIEAFRLRSKNGAPDLD